MHILESLEDLRDSATGYSDVYLSTVSHRVNLELRTLTVVATIFMPATLLAGYLWHELQGSCPGSTNPLDSPTSWADGRHRGFYARSSGDDACLGPAAVEPYPRPWALSSRSVSHRSRIRLSGREQPWRRKLVEQIPSEARLQPLVALVAG